MDEDAIISKNVFDALGKTKIEAYRNGYCEGFADALKSIGKDIGSPDIDKFYAVLLAWKEKAGDEFEFAPMREWYK